MMLSIAWPAIGAQEIASQPAEGIPREEKGQETRPDPIPADKTVFWAGRLVSISGQSKV